MTVTLKEEDVEKEKKEMLKEKTKNRRNKN